MSNPHHIALSPSQIKELIGSNQKVDGLFLDVRRKNSLLNL